MADPRADPVAALTSYPEDELAALPPEQLFDLLHHNEDRVPRAVIDACARHGDRMVEALEVLDGPYDPDEEEPGAWWANLHAVMVLGLIPTEAAGLLAVRMMRLAAEMEDGDLQEWLSGYWPALFANKPDTVLPALCAICADRRLDWYVRANALDPLVAAAERRGPEALDEELDRMAHVAADEQEDWDVRLSCAQLLLDFPRTRHRALLDDLASRQEDVGATFLAGDIERAYAVGDEPEWRRFEDPWEFYRPESIAERQERWAREGGELEDDFEVEDDFEDVDDRFPFEEPYVRPNPKVGRNDPCPCGSGKKFKKCCLDRLTR